MDPPVNRRSLFAYSPGLVFVAVAIADSIAVIDPDLWGHLRFGQAILSNHGPVFQDLYSYSAPGHIWIDYEWLGEALWAAAFTYGGVLGLALMKLGCAAMIVFFLILALAETGASTQIQFGVLVFSAVVVRPQLQFRPQSLTFLLFTVLIWTLARHTYRRAGPLWMLAPMFALWANLHGGFVLGLAALGIYSTVTGLEDVARGRGYSQALRLGGITTLSALATLATPYGIGIWEAIFRTLRDPATRSLITEWQPLVSTIVAEWRRLGIHVSNYEVGCAMMVALAVSWYLSRDILDLPLIAIAAAISVAAFLAQRNLPIAALAIAPPLARHCYLAIARRRLATQRTLSEGLWWANQAVLSAIAVLILVHSGLFSSQIASIDLYPVNACDFMRRNHLSGNILSEYDWGEYLIWRMAPQSKVFIDGRYDTVYPPNVLADYVLFHYDLADGEKVLRDFPHEFILIRPDAKSRKLVESNEDWRLIYADDAARLYARKNARGLDDLKGAGLLPGAAITPAVDVASDLLSSKSRLPPKVAKP